MIIPWKLLGESRTPDGTLITLTRRGNEFSIMADGKDLMSSGMKGSEQALASLGCARAAKLEAPCVLVGGLGMGFTLRAAIDALPQEDASIVVAEIVPAVLEWNKGPLGPLADHPLRDRRVTVELRDVADVIREGVGRFDALLLDVDNGPVAFTQVANGGLYGNAGLAAAKASLREGGIAAYWSAWDDRKFEHSMRYAGFDLEVVHVRARLKGGGPMHTLFIGRL